MTDTVAIQITGSVDAIAHLLSKFGTPVPPAKPEPWRKIETPWFEWHGKLTRAEAEEMEVGFYGKR